MMNSQNFYLARNVAAIISSSQPVIQGTKEDSHARDPVGQNQA